MKINKINIFLFILLLLITIVVGCAVASNSGSSSGSAGSTVNSSAGSSGSSASPLPSISNGYATATTGGAGATPVTVTNRAELVAALTGTAPKIIYISGTIDLCVDPGNAPLGEADFIRDDLNGNTGTLYSIDAYKLAYDPATYGTTSKPSGQQENARKNSQRAQQAVIQIQVTSNTSLIGLGTDAKIKNGNLMIDKANNIIIKNISFEDAYDYFPAWDPTDGSTGNWNSQYDLISIQNAPAGNIWIDHCTFSDGARPDSSFPLIFGREYQHHDGAVDITKQANNITVSYCYFFNHDKTNLIGGSDTNPDTGYLKITFHHNFYDGTVQRCPRVRFGELHIYNNYYKNLTGNSFTAGYAIGIGASCSIYIENNYLENVTTHLYWYDSSTKPGAFQDVGNSPALSTTGLPSYTSTIVSWKPSDRYVYIVDPAANVPTICQTYSGAGKPDRP